MLKKCLDAQIELLILAANTDTEWQVLHFMDRSISITKNLVKMIQAMQKRIRKLEKEEKA